MARYELIGRATAGYFSRRSRTDTFLAEISSAYASPVSFSSSSIIALSSVASTKARMFYLSC